ncbi:MAG: hypothetical protein PSV16_11370 [Flavobacterium sp.]|nr:hypothetical protein [Flavobacterium sp.]
MSKSRFDNTDLENLISNLRGEIGVIIQSWTLMRDLLFEYRSLCSDDFIKDSQNNKLSKLHLLKKKVENEIIAALSELGEKKYRYVNFYFATAKLNAYKADADEFENFLKLKNIRAKRHEFISHKDLPATFDEQVGEYRIEYFTLLRAICKAVILMKKIDKQFIGINSKYQWIEIRKRRYDYSLSARAAYLLLPYIKISTTNNDSA